MKKTFFSIFAFTLSSIVFSQDSVSVLFIGNSYTSVNNLPVMVEDLATSLGDIVYHASQTPGGTTFQGHASNAATYTKINSEQWDFVVLQAQSQEPSFPDTQVDTQTIPPAMQIKDSIYANKFCTDIMMYMTWGRENGDPQWGPISTFDGMNARLRSAYIRIADSLQGSVSAVGSAWKYVRDNHPTIGLYAGDGSHPSVEGSYLAACTFYASLFRKSPVGASYISTLPVATATILQNAAALTVLDSLEFWNLRPISEHTQADYGFIVNGNSVEFTNLSTKATNYYWDFGDLNTSASEDPTHVFSSNATYTVQLIAESQCDTDTITYQVIIDVAELNQNFKEGFMIKYKGSGVFEVNQTEKIKALKVYNIEGREIKVNSKYIDLSANPYGIYFLKIETENGIVNIRLPYFNE